MVRAAAEGRLGVLVLAGVDLIRDYGPRELAERALENCFVVAIDHGLNDTTRHADVLLPGIVHAETDGTFTDWEGRVQEQHAVVDVAGAAQSVWELADQLGVRLRADIGLAGFGRVRAETERFRARPSGAAAPTPAAGAAAGAGAGTAGGTAASVELAGPEDGLALVSYPLLLDAASMLARADDLNRETEPAFAELHPEDAKRLGVRDGDAVEVDLGGGHVIKLPASVTTNVVPGCVFIPANQPDLSLGELLGTGAALRVAVRAAEEVAA
jgi:NADH-quinone oxidoreductase subunit G